MKNKTILSIIFILFFVIFSKIVTFSSKYKSDDYKKEYLVFVESKKKETENMVSYNVFLGDQFKDKFIIKIYDSDYIDLTNYTNLKYGDILSISGKIVVPEYMNNPGEFNYKYYLYSNNIYGEISVSKINSITKLKLGVKEKLISYIYNYKEYLGNILERYMNVENIELAKSIIYGETMGLDEETKSSFEQTGLSHITSISGSNISSIASVIVILILPLKLKGKTSKIMLLVIIIMFVILTGSSLSTLRAGIMASISVIFSLLNKKIHPLKSLLIALVIILIHTPYCIFNIGFLLSFLATFGIIVFVNPLNEIVKNLTDKIKTKFIKNLVKIILLNLSVILSVQIMIIPLQINSFNTFSPTHVIFNILVSGITNIITILGAIFILFSYVPILNFLVVKLINICISFLIFLVNFFKAISLNISLMDLPYIAIILYYCIVLSFLIKIYLKKFLISRKYNINKKEWKKYSVVQIVLVIITIIVVFCNAFYFKNVSSFVYFFNVGQGEMSYIKCGKSSIIVDIGSMKTNLAYNTISNYFKMKNISGVEAIILSHMHTDHVNGLEEYLKNYNVGVIIYSNPVEETETYMHFKEIVNEYNVKYKEVTAGEKFNFGNIQIEMLLPKETLLKVNDSINANSLVCKVSVNDKKIMYMGDGTNDTEKELLKLYDLERVDILKVGHHGSKTSTTREYIERIKPQYAVISAKKSYYNHPHESVLEILKKYNVKIYITEKIGAIKYNL